MDRSHSRSASPREPARPQHRPPSPPAAFENRAYEHDDYDPNHNDSFNSNGPNQNGHSKEPNGETKTLEAVNLELVNLTPKNGSAKQRKDVEVDLNTNNPYDEYFVPVNEHRKYMRGEKLYVTADKRGEKGGCKRPLCWTLLGLVVVAIVALIVLAATGILFTNSPTPLEPYNTSVSSARALGGITNTINNEQVHDNNQVPDEEQNQEHNHSHDHSHAHNDREQNNESEQYGERDQTTERVNNQEQENSQEDISRENQDGVQGLERTTAIPSDGHRPQMQNDEANEQRSSASEEIGDKSIYVPQTLEGELKIDNDEFTPALEDPESDDYLDFVASFGNALLQALLDKNNLEYNDNDIDLVITKIRRGSIIVTYRIYWSPKYNTQSSENLFTPVSLKDNLNVYLAQNNRMLSIYHIAEDSLTTRRVLDICQINNNGCEFGCEFDERNLDFICTCPHGQMIDMKQPKKCMSLLDNSEEIKNSSKTNVFTSELDTVTTNPNSEEEKPNTEPVYVLQKENGHNPFAQKETVPLFSEITTENDGDVNFSHIFGSSIDENDEHITEMPKHQPETSEEHNKHTQENHFLTTTQQAKIEATTMSEKFLRTNGPISEPEPTSEPQPDAKFTTTVISFEPKPLNKNEETQVPQPNQEQKPAFVPQFIPITTTSTEPQPTPEPQLTTEPILYQTTETKIDVNSESIMSAEPNNLKDNLKSSDNDNVTTTEASSIKMLEDKYNYTSHYMFGNKFDTTTTFSDLDISQPESMSEKNVSENGDKTTTENDWLEDTSESSQIPKNEISNIQENTVLIDRAMENDNNKGTDERSSKAFENEFLVDDSSLKTTTSQETYMELDSNSTNGDYSLEQNKKVNDIPITKETVNEESRTTTAVSIAQLFFGKKPPGDESRVNGLFDTTTMSILTGIEENRQFFNNETVENNTNDETTQNQISLFGNASVSSMISENPEATTPAIEPNTEYSIAKQNKEFSIDKNLMTVLKNTNISQSDDINSELNVTTEKDFVEGDITFDAINKLYNRSSKSFENNKENIGTGTETNDLYHETTETTTGADWISETVTEINYQDILNENKNRITTEDSVTKLDEIMGRGMNKDDFEPDYLNMGPNTTKSLEHDMPQYGMLHDYDNDDLVIKRVKNEPSMMIDETTMTSTIHRSSKENETEGNVTSRPIMEMNNTFETTTIIDYIYKMSLNDSNQNLNFTLSTTNRTQSVPQVWESSENDTEKLATPIIQIAIPDTTTILPITTSDYEQKSKQDDTMNTLDSNMKTSNASQGSNLNVNIYEISSHNTNQSMEKSVNHHSAEYVDHETEMNPFLPEIENNKSLVKKLQEGHDLEPSNVNETQNENIEEQPHRVSDGSMASNNQTEHLSATLSSSTETTSVTTMDNEAVLKELLMPQEVSSTEERSRTSIELNKDTETTPSVDQLDDDAKELSDQNDALPVTTFLLDTDDLDSTKDPLDRENVRTKFDRNFEASMEPMTSEITTENKIKQSDSNELLSVVPIEPENIEEQENFKYNYERENIPELNQISDSPKKSDRRTVDSSNINSLIGNEA